MLVLKQNPAGIDDVIDTLQQYLWNEFPCFESWDSYPRAYRNPARFNDRGFIPECYDENGEYIEVFHNDNVSMTTFFVAESDREIDNRLATQRLSLIVQCNLKDLFPDISHRADEELINLFWRKIEYFKSVVTLISIETQIDNVYREFSRNGVKFDDMGDLFVCRFNMTAEFTSSCKIDC